MSANQLLPMMFSPVVFSLILVLLGVWIRSRRLSFVGGAILFLASLPGLMFPLYDFHQGYVRRVSEPMPNCTTGAIVVLAGAMTPASGEGNRIINEWGDAVDRILGGVDLWKKGCSQRLVLSSGPPVDESKESEGAAMRRFAQELGVSENAITILPFASNTESEAVIAAELLLPAHRRIALVTSAFHMRRATMLFEDAGFEVYQSPADIRVPPDGYGPSPWLPNMMALNRADIMVRETLGLIYYRIKIWLFN